MTAQSRRSTQSTTPPTWRTPAAGALVVLTVVPRVTLPVFPEEGYGAAPLTTAQDFGDYQDKMRDMYQMSQKEVMKDIAEHFPKLHD